MPPTPVIVVIEDQTALSQVIQDVLSDEGYEVLPVRDQFAAVATLRSERVDLVIADLSTPDDDGPDPLVEIRADFAEVPLIELRDPTPQAVPFFGPWRRDGSHVTLRRPFKLDHLLEAVRELIP